MSTRIARPVALPRDIATLRVLALQVFDRTAGAPLVGGNAVRVLRDARENYPAWEDAIRHARTLIQIEMYIFHHDRVGKRFVELLTAKAAEGVRVQVLYDWFGCGLSPLRGLFRPLVAAGGQVRTFNPPALTSALGWLRRDHRKLLVIDREVAFVSGLCIGQAWEGNPARGQDPWRDTGLEIRGPAVAGAQETFADSWSLAGGSREECLLPISPGHRGDVNLHLIPTEPFTANLLRMDLLVTTLARRSLWITDAYFIGTGPYLEALKRAAADGVDVRLLLPQGSDVGWTVPVSRSLYRPLIEAGVRIFEWNGTMVHAKTAVADGRWARIGSTNLNLNSWIGNWELDVAITDDGVAGTLAGHFEEDLLRSTEIVLGRRQSRTPRQTRADPIPERARRSSRRVVRTVTGMGRSLGAAVTGNRPLEDFEIVPVMLAALVLALVAIVAFVAPRALAWPLAVIAAWTALTFVAEAWFLRRRRRK
jgi:phosphatidylserine/phosphatidylglycerophosphate/cardiolipin synthase-like enzyme